MKRPWLVAAALALGLSSAGSSWADFFTKRADWDRASPDHRAVYVEGLFDGIYRDFVDDPAAARARNNGVYKCVVARHDDGPSLAALVSDGYARKPEWSRESPSLVLENQLLAVCRPNVNEERKRLGLGPLPD